MTNKMKTLFSKPTLASLTLFAVSSAAWAGSNYGMAGCGLGASVFRDEPGKIQILAATLNNIISPQTSAITSGTSNCYEESSRQEASLFIQINKVALEKDISRGNGETISALSKILECSDVSQLGNTLQQNYASIFPSPNTESSAVGHAIGQAIQASPSLAPTCKVTI